MPLKNKTGWPIGKIEHRSDFGRTEVLYDLDGTYMDMDIIPIRDIKNLRLSGLPIS
jgi:mannosyltransferase OCH1-like enzyme